MKSLRINKKNSKAILKSRALLHQVARDPYVDWAIIFGIAFIVALCLVADGVYTYLNLDSQLGSPTESQVGTAAVDTKTLTQVLGQYDGRSSARTDLLRGYAGPGDPSI